MTKNERLILISLTRVAAHLSQTAEALIPLLPTEELKEKYYKEINSSTDELNNITRLMDKEWGGESNEQS